MGVEIDLAEALLQIFEELSELRAVLSRERGDHVH